MHKALIGLGVAAALVSAGGVGAATAFSANDDDVRDMHMQMAEFMPMNMGSMPMTTSGMGPMHTEEMDALHAQMVAAMPEELRDACNDAHTAHSVHHADQ